jgi:hypothetical protein
MIESALIRPATLGIAAEAQTVVAGRAEAMVSGGLSVTTGAATERLGEKCTPERSVAEAEQGRREVG